MNERAVEVAARNATLDRATIDAGRSCSEPSAQGATAANVQMVFVMLAVFSPSIAGPMTIDDASTTRSRAEVTHPRLWRYTNQASSALTIDAATAAYNASWRRGTAGTSNARSRGGSCR